ncbi:MAG: (2Fe-2S)-binding protein [Halobacteriovoraceae bacterium]|jgi:ferredoxin, 2Fe-2S|nr:(2Fe-2S)-binding protein [Halobacteriovoraceae bacterium]
MYKIKVIPENKVIEVNQGDNLRTSLIAAGFEIKSPCGGCASCAQCVVKIVTGCDNLNEIPFEERQLLGNVFHLTAERLSCQTIVNGDIEVDISQHMISKKEPSHVLRRTRKEADDIIEQRRENSKNKPQKQGGFKKPKSFTSIDDK